jgi:hypothetical protein
VLHEAGRLATSRRCRRLPAPPLAGPALPYAPPCATSMLLAGSPRCRSMRSSKNTGGSVDGSSAGCRHDVRGFWPITTLILQYALGFTQFNHLDSLSCLVGDRPIPQNLHCQLEFHRIGGVWALNRSGFLCAPLIDDSFPKPLPDQFESCIPAARGLLHLSRLPPCWTCRRFLFGKWAPCRPISTAICGCPGAPPGSLA